MDYSGLSSEQRSALVEMVGRLQGLMACAKSQAKRDGILDLGYIAGNQDAQTVRSTELVRLIESYPKPEVS